jgi:hypothetical protein
LPVVNQINNLQVVAQPAVSSADSAWKALKAGEPSLISTKTSIGLKNHSQMCLESRMRSALESEAVDKDASPRGDILMNRASAIALLTLASVASCTGAMAQGLKANVPFDFTVGNKWMPAGEYTLTSPSDGVLALRSGTHITMIATLQSSDESRSGSKLVFDKYDDQYFLHEVLCPNLVSLNLRIPKSKAEKRAREHTVEAKGPVDGDQTMVAAR